MMDLTFTVIWVTVGFLILFDLWVIHAKGYEATISWTGLKWAKRYPILAFAMGIAIGHMLWPNDMPQADCEEVREN